MRHYLIAAMTICLTASAASGQKTDILVLMNGDRITGEVKGLLHGALRYSTDDAGTLSVEWDKVASLTSVNIFEVELKTERRIRGAGGQGEERKIFGTMGEGPEPGTIMVGREVLSMSDIVAITEISPSFWKRTSGYLDIGWSLAKANEAQTLNLGAEAKYRGPMYGSGLTLQLYVQDDDDSELTRRNSLDLDFYRIFGTAWAWPFFGGISLNDELSLDLRYFLGTGARRRIVRTDHLDAIVTAGGVASREKYSGEEKSTWSGEIAAEVDFSAFRLDSPELDVNTTLQGFVSVTESDRYRTSFNLRARYELLHDFFLGLTFTASYDTNPPAPSVYDVVKGDFTSALSVGWSW